MPPDASAGAGELVLQVEDVTLADAPAPVVAAGSWHVDLAEPLGEFVLEGLLAERRRYSLRATLDLDADGKIGVGDLLSVVSVPIRPGDQQVLVPLARVG